MGQDIEEGLADSKILHTARGVHFDLYILNKQIVLNACCKVRNVLELHRAGNAVLTEMCSFPLTLLMFLPPLCFQVCREYQRGNCSRGESDCRFAHPADSTMIDTNDNTVTVCMDYIKGRCSREKCKYFHPPAHLQAKIKATQHQVNQATAAAAMVSTRGHTHAARYGGFGKWVQCASRLSNINEITFLWLILTLVFEHLTVLVGSTKLLSSAFAR